MYAWDVYGEENTHLVTPNYHYYKILEWALSPRHSNRMYVCLWVCVSHSKWCVSTQVYYSNYLVRIATPARLKGQALVARGVDCSGAGLQLAFKTWIILCIKDFLVQW